MLAGLLIAGAGGMLAVAAARGQSGSPSAGGSPSGNADSDSAPLGLGFLAGLEPIPRAPPVTEPPRDEPPAAPTNTRQRTPRMESVELRHFEPSEFHGWWDQMSVPLLKRLDEFREQWGAPVRISPADGAVGRRDGSGSDHDVTTQGEVRAVDAFPKGLNGPRDAQRARRIARRVGLTAIGVYPEAEPSPMVHLGWRPERSPQDPAEWTALRSGAGWDYVAPSRDQQRKLYA